MGVGAGAGGADGPLEPLLAAFAEDGGGSVEPAPGELDALTREALRALGYLE